MARTTHCLITATLALLLAGSSGTAAAQPAGDEPNPPPNDGEKAAPEGTSTTPATTPATDASSIDIDALRQEYLKLRDQLFRSRARAAAVGSALYSTRMTVHLNYTTARFYTVNRATVRLDGANVFDDTDGSIASNKAARFDGFVAPGRHVVTMRIEASGKDDDRFTSVIENTYVVQAVAGKNLVVWAKAKDDGDIPFNWKKKQSGSYKLHLDVSVKTEKRGKKSNERIRRK